MTSQCLDKTRLFTLGLLAACGFFAALFAAIVLWLRGSSRGHRILIESAIVLVLGLPLAGTQLVSDLNQYVGTPERTVITREITGTRHETRRRKRRTEHYYYLDFAQVAESPFPVPRSLRVEEELYDSAAAGRTAQLHVASGWLGIPWIEKVEVR
ncbi:MAG: hypothetical protein HC897_07355 [Thermoanaerobaculia bacterium]|nr:hypothetical protein [Thermoanaerobaculia bacterium]